MSDTLRDWLSQEIEQRNWSHRDLAKKTGLSQSIISKTLSGERNPSADFCIKIAQALDEPPEKLLRLAEILPPLPTSENDPRLQELIDLLHNMPPKQIDEALRYIRYLYQSRQKDD